ncbi:hypothetical protein HYS94_02335 [Candidatus Daviesbacteria bacterium]|nr:hypothetical protein [Candidatus Daviesbacteria bacterium]
MGSPEQRQTKLNSPLLYTQADRSRLLEWHFNIAEKFGVKEPYFNFSTDLPSEKKSLIRVRNYFPGIDLIIGPLRAFSRGEVAAVIHDQVVIYVMDRALGNFPIGDTEAEEELVASMIGGFNQHDVFISFHVRSQESFKPVAGGRLTFGRSQESLVKNITREDDSHIQTFNALHVKEETLSKSPLANTSESEVVCISRYFCQPRQVLKELRLENIGYRLPLYTVAHFVGGYVGYAQREGLPVPKFAVYDTHLSSLAEVTRKKFGAEVIASGEDVSPTKLILGTILRYHYGGLEYGGYKNHIMVVAFPTTEYLKGAERVLGSSLALPF